MKVFDFNIHLPVLDNKAISMHGNKLENALSDDLTLGIEDLIACFNYHHHAGSFKEIDNGNFMIFNPSLFKEAGDHDGFFDLVKSAFPDAFFTALLDPQHADFQSYIANMASAGVHAIKFHTYLQKIGTTDFGNIVRYAKLAEEAGLLVVLDTSYGGRDIYNYFPLQVAAAVVKEVSEVPVILLHSGGGKAIDAGLLAMSGDNVWLETSYTLPYYEGSSIWDDLAFTYRKLNCDRVLFGSDFPYVNGAQNMAVHQRFFEYFQFSQEEQDKIMFVNAHRLAKIDQ